MIVLTYSTQRSDYGEKDMLFRDMMIIAIFSIWIEIHDIVCPVIIDIYSK